VKAIIPFALCALAVGAWGATSTAWEVSGYSNFLKGRLSGLSLTADGELTPGPALRFGAELNQPALWSLAVGHDGSVYAATGHRGKVLRVGPDGKGSLLWSAEQAEVFALCVDAKGVLYAGTSPNGGVYRIEHGKATELWHSPEKYIWALQPTPDGGLYVATGEAGRIYRIRPGGQAEVYFQTGQGNVTALALGGKGQLYAGSDPNGILYEITAANQGTVVFDSSLPEIRAIRVGVDGTLYVAAMGGAVSSRTANPAGQASSASTVAVANSPTVITVTAEAKENGPNGVPAATQGDNRQVEGAVKPSADQAKTQAQPTATSSTPSAAVVDTSGVEKSAIYRISSDHTVETLRSSKEDNVYDLWLNNDGSVLFSTDVHGRIYRLREDKTTLVVELGDGEATRLVQVGSTLYAGLSTPGRVFAFDASKTGGGSYESEVHDSNSVARWGHLQWHGTGSGVVFQTRTGNSARPDGTWSTWSGPLRNSGEELIGSPVARFIQWRATWPAGSTPQIDLVDVPFLPQNTAPVVHSITATPVVGTNTAKQTVPNPNASGAYSITVTDTGEAPAASSTSNAAQTASRLQTTQTQLTWQADDADGDKLMYAIYLRAEEERQWHLVRNHLFETTLTLDPDVLADGRYLFRVVVSDAASNAPPLARTGELVSAPLLIDTTPPTVTVGMPSRNGTVLDLDVTAEDQTSPLRRCEYSLDAGLWQPLEATDGITDSPHERFHLHLDKLPTGEHLLAFRVYDAANNAGLAKVVLR